MITIGARRLTTADLVRIAREDVAVELAPSSWSAIEAAHATLQRLAGDGAAIYGVSTGLGAAVDTAIAPDSPDRQRRIPLARSAGVGRRGSREEVRAMMAARIARLATGRSGASRAIVAALLAMLNGRVHPVVPMTGSVGAADLVPLAHIAAVLAGAGEAEFGDKILPAAEALARIGLRPPVFSGKDGLALVSSNAASVGLACLAVADAAMTLDAALVAAALSLEAYRGSLAPFDPRAAALRDAPGQAEAARRLLTLLSGSDLFEAGRARRLQDPVSFRAVASVHGAAATALAAARAAAEGELNSSDDNPAVIAEDGLVLPNANFDPTHLALTLESLGAAIVRLAATAGGRILHLMSPSSSALPRFLAPHQDGSNGLATVQKTVAALIAEMQHASMPMPTVLLDTADHVEDYATMAAAIAAKTAEIAAAWRLVVAAELIVAAQACDLRDAIRLGKATAAAHAEVREVVAPLDRDRPMGRDIEAVAARVGAGAFSLAERPA